MGNFCNKKYKKKHSCVTPKLLSNENELNKYKILNFINNGAYGKIYTVKNKINNRLLIMKKIKNPRSFKNEFNYFKLDIHHPNLIIYHELLSKDNNKFYIIMDKYDNDLFNILQENNKLDEVVVKNYIYQILSALKELEYYNYYHLDIKLDNILVDKHSNKIILTDFGSMCRIQKKYNYKKVTQPLGTKIYIAPEILYQKIFCRTSDIWSLGVLTFFLFKNQSIPEEILNNKSNLNSMIYDCDKLSNKCLDFLDLTIEPDYIERLNINECLNHNWFNNDVIII